MLAKRILCGLVAFCFIFIGAIFINDTECLWKWLSFSSFVLGATLMYIAIKQNFPNYSFWITLVAIALAYSLLLDKIELSSSSEQNLSQPQDQVQTKEKRKTIKKKKKRRGFNFSAYPKLSGPAEVLHAHVFYIAGRYVRLYGVDAPDIDQLCADATGSAYSCGENAASWVRGWIDDNPIDCYLLKVEPHGQDLATCMWGKYDIGAALVGSGWGVAKTKETAIYKPYETRAQNQSIGLWQGTFYDPEDWRNIKKHRNDFKIKRNTEGLGDSAGGFFNFGSWF